MNMTPNTAMDPSGLSFTPLCETLCAGMRRRVIATALDGSRFAFKPARGWVAGDSERRADD
jgi:hypothetical protein